jgi:hypothetical protein
MRFRWEGADFNMAFDDRREVPREPVRLPIRWADGLEGWSRDISPEGVYVYVHGTHAFQQWCALEVDYAPAQLRYRGLAQVLRVEPLGDLTGVALRLQPGRIRRIP